MTDRALAHPWDLNSASPRWNEARTGWADEWKRRSMYARKPWLEAIDRCAARGLDVFAVLNQACREGRNPLVAAESAVRAAS